MPLTDRRHTVKSFYSHDNTLPSPSRLIASAMDVVITFALTTTAATSDVRHSFFFPQMDVSKRLISFGESKPIGYFQENPSCLNNLEQYR